MLTVDQKGVLLAGSRSGKPFLTRSPCR